MEKPEVAKYYVAYADPEEKVMAAMIEILEGFTWK